VLYLVILKAGIPKLAWQLVQFWLSLIAHLSLHFFVIVVDDLLAIIFIFVHNCCCALSPVVNKPIIQNKIAIHKGESYVENMPTIFSITS